MIYGLRVGPSYDGSPRSVISKKIETTVAGNAILRVGRENENGQGWRQTEHVVLPIDEALSLASALLTAAADAIESGAAVIA